MFVVFGSLVVVPLVVEALFAVSVVFFFDASQLGQAESRRGPLGREHHGEGGAVAEVIGGLELRRLRLRPGGSRARWAGRALGGRREVSALGEFLRV